MFQIRDASPDDQASWQALWHQYTVFSNIIILDDVTSRTWGRILDPASPLICRLADRDGKIIGFSVSVIHEGTWVMNPICYLEDLFVEEAERGKGIGRALIEDLIDMGKRLGWSRLYWHTHLDNIAARRLYDAFVLTDGFIRYRISLDDPA